MKKGILKKELNNHVTEDVLHVTVCDCLVFQRRTGRMYTGGVPCDEQSQSDFITLKYDIH